MEKSALINRQLAWDAYWGTGALHSCASSYGGNYGGAVAEFWGRRFDGLAPQGRVLDLATGNGALPLLLLQRAGDDSLIELDAVDFAAIAPTWPDSALRSSVRFWPGVSMESLPFDDATFDLVISQFGLEYASWPTALGEAMRVCKPQGTAAFVLHHADSVLVDVGRHELTNQRALVAEDGLLRAARNVMPWMARVRAGDAVAAGDTRARDSRERYNRAMESISDAVAISPVPDLLLEARERVHRIVTATTSVDLTDSLAMLDEYQMALEAAALRTAEMIDHALDAEAIEAMRGVIGGLRPHCRFTAEPIVQEQGIMGWGVVVEP